MAQLYRRFLGFVRAVLWLLRVQQAGAFGQGSGRAIEAEVKRQSGHYRRSASNWVAAVLLTLAAGLGMIMYWYAHVPRQTQIQIGDVPAPPPAG